MAYLSAKLAVASPGINGSESGRISSSIFSEKGQPGGYL